MEGDTGGIRHFLRRKDALADLLFQDRLRRQRVEQIIRGQHVVFTQTVPLGKSCKIAQCGCDFQQLPHGEDPALLGMSGNAPHIGNAAKARTSVLDQKRVDGVGLCKRKTLIFRCGTRLQCLHHFLGFTARTKLYRPCDDFIQFQCGFISGIHTGYSFSLFQYSLQKIQTFQSMLQVCQHILLADPGQILQAGR